MGKGEKLQAVQARVNTKLQTQNVSITFRKTAVTEGDFGTSYSAVDTDVTISAGIEIGSVKGYETAPNGTVQLGDLKLTVPGGLLTESQIQDCTVLYQGQTYTLQTYAPTEILFGVPLSWIIVARRQV